MRLFTLWADPTVPQFREWLNHLGAGEYLQKFIEAGYDLPFIAKQGIEDTDLDCIGIPKSKMGIRRKIVSLYNLDKYYTAEEDDDDDEEEEDDEEDDEDEDDEEEEDDDE